MLLLVAIVLDGRSAPSQYGHIQPSLLKQDWFLELLFLGGKRRCVTEAGLLHSKRKRGKQNRSRPICEFPMLHICVMTRTLGEEHVSIWAVLVGTPFSMGTEFSGFYYGLVVPTSG